MRHFIFFCVAFATVACSHYPADVERALKFAGVNRAELEKVLEHYGKQPENTLKLQAAYFLIANMPYHFTMQEVRLDSFKTYLKNNHFQEGLLAYYEKTYEQINGTTEIKPDLYHMTSEFLIRNIDFSFYIWQKTPWGNHFSFDQFCENILPYRISHEPLEYWKEEYYAAFRPIIDSMACYTIDEVSQKLLEHIKTGGWNYEGNFQSHGFGASILLEKRYGNCKEIAEFVAYALRSIGIPSGIEHYIQSPLGNTISHFVNFRYNSTGECIRFDFYVDSYLEHGRRGPRKFGKVYRQCYALQKESLPVKHKDIFIPPGGLRDFLLKDVSFECFPDTHISVRLDSSVLFDRKDMAYLCVFNNSEWIPVAWSKPENGMVRFRNVEPGVLFQIRLIDETRNVSASKPFILHGNEMARFLDADITHLQSMRLLRKFRVPLEWPNWIHRSVNGKFQGANRPDFSDAVTLHTIQNYAEFSYVDLRPEHPGKFNYVRYLSADNGYNNMAEVMFYSEGKRLHGEVIGTDGSKDVFPNSTKYAVFDDDPLSFFDALEADEAWAGLQFNKAYHIDVIRYIFRNDDNTIRPGDTYELRYQNNGEWLSAGRQTADTTLLHFENVPSNTLYWLHNHTRGKEERPFTYENGKQIWW